MAFIDTDDLEIKEPIEGWKGRYFHSENMTLAYYTVKSGSAIHEHAHENDEVWNIIEGEFEVTIDGQVRIAGPGFAAVVPPNTPHAVKALSDGRAIVVDHPRRRSVGGVDIA